MCRFPAFETGSADRTAGACRRGPAEPELLPGTVDTGHALAAISFAARVLTGTDITWHKGDIWVIIAYAAWAFAYFAYSWAASGRTAGMALFGVRVVQDDGTGASGRRAVVRTLAFPLSFLFLGLGFAGILLGDRRRALHDVIAGTAVIYSWDARAARLRFLSQG